jgi:hypothetical protein
VNPYQIVLLNQFLQGRTVWLANDVKVGRHVRRVKLVANAIEKSGWRTARRNRYRADDSTNLKFCSGSFCGFFVLELAWNDYEGNVPKTAEKPRDIQHALLRPVGPSQRPVGSNEKDFWTECTAV